MRNIYADGRDASDGRRGGHRRHLSGGEERQRARRVAAHLRAGAGLLRPRDGGAHRRLRLAAPLLPHHHVLPPRGRRTPVLLPLEHGQTRTLFVRFTRSSTMIQWSVRYVVFRLTTIYICRTVESIKGHLVLQHFRPRLEL
jgi:hypothetical protein